MILAKQANKICEKMKSFEKTGSYVKEFMGIVDGLADNRSPWFLVGKNEKAQEPTEPKTAGSKKNLTVSTTIIWEQYHEKYKPFSNS